MKIKLNLIFKIKETEKFYVEKINIFGNNITRENVIRNQLIIDEGDPFNEILANKSINNIKSLNFFKNVKSEIKDGKNKITKIINITVEEKPTGEILWLVLVLVLMVEQLFLVVKENNFLGKGIALDTNFQFSLMV